RRAARRGGGIHRLPGHRNLVARALRRAPSVPRAPLQVRGLGSRDLLRLRPAGARSVSTPTIVCTLGMHRSGTSLVSRILNVRGVYLGPEEHLMRPSADNPTGHWESRLIKQINDEILSILGGTWQEPPPLPTGWERSPELAAPRRRAREIIEGDFAGSELWGFKDPRSSLTLPFWQRILDPMRYVICLRNPIDVAASAQDRSRENDAVPFEHGIELWLTYV